MGVERAPWVRNRTRADVLKPEHFTWKEASHETDYYCKLCSGRPKAALRGGSAHCADDCRIQRVKYSAVMVVSHSPNKRCGATIQPMRQGGKLTSNENLNPLPHTYLTANASAVVCSDTVATLWPGERAHKVSGSCSSQLQHYTTCPCTEPPQTQHSNGIIPSGSSRGVRADSVGTTLNFRAPLTPCAAHWILCFRARHTAQLGHPTQKLAAFEQSL